MTTWDKVKNIWDYDKWFILGGIAIAVLLFFFVKDVFFKEKCDIPVTYIATGYLSDEQVKEVKSVFSDFTDDFNGDGKKNVSVYTIQFSPKNSINAQMDKEANTALVAEFMTQSNCIFIINDEKYHAVFDEDSSALYDLSGLDNSLSSGTLRIPVSETVLGARLDFLSDDLYIILRVPFNKNNKSDFDHAKNVLECLLNTK